MAKPYDPKDFYYRKAKKAGLRARSAFKIEEILRRHRLLGRGDAVLDLGAAPGGFLQILAEAVGETGVAVGVDLEPIRNLGKAWVRTAVMDLLAPDALERIRALHHGRFRLVTSDMAPKTIGIKVTDEARSLELVRMALEVARRTLEPGGAFVAKVFMGGDFPELRRELHAQFESFHVVRPEAVRESSYEVYVLGKGFRGNLAASTPNPDANAGPVAPGPTSTPNPDANAKPPPVPATRVPGPVAPGPTATPTATSTPIAPPTPATQKKPASTRRAPAKKSAATAKPTAKKKPTAKAPSAKKPAPKRPTPRRRAHPKAAPPSRTRR